MKTNSPDLSFLRWDKYFWIGKSDVFWLGQDIWFNVHVDKDKRPPSQAQKELVHKVILFPRNKREELEQFIFDQYQNDIYGSIDPITWTPKLNRSSEIWSLLSQSGLTFPADSGSGQHHRFVATFKCAWDDEHGLGVLYEDFIPTKLGGTGDFF